MAAPTLPIDQVARRIEEYEAQLNSLKREYEARMSKLDELQRRRKQLLSDLNEVEGRIKAITGKETPAAEQKPTAPAKQAAPAANGTAPGSFPEFLLLILREAGRPLTNKDLAEEVQRRRYPTRSTDLRKQIATRVGEMIKKGLLRRTKDGGILIRVKGGAAKHSPAPTAASPSPRKSTIPPGQPSLKTMLTQVLAKSTKPMTSGEVARAAEKAGYKSQSGDFANLVGVTLRRMDNVKHYKGKGYLLKRG
jgi:hypothetical protein